MIVALFVYFKNFNVGVTKMYPCYLVLYLCVICSEIHGRKSGFLIYIEETRFFPYSSQMPIDIIF